MTRVLRWGRVLFVGSTSTLLIPLRFETRLEAIGFAVLFLALAHVTVVTLPLGIVSVWRESDSASRRNWLLLLRIVVNGYSSRNTVVGSTRAALRAGT
jgi:hypothetical protein